MEEERIRELKQELFAYRNGIIADALRKSGDPHTMILGCQLTDLATISSRHEKSVELAHALWACRSNRECRLLSPMLYPLENATIDDAVSMALDVQTEEEADVLCHKLLRSLPFSLDLASQLAQGSDNRGYYVALRLILNMISLGKNLGQDWLNEMLQGISAKSQDRRVLTLIRQIESEEV